MTLYGAPAWLPWLPTQSGSHKKFSVLTSTSIKIQSLKALSRSQQACKSSELAHTPRRTSGAAQALPGVRAVGVGPFSNLAQVLGDVRADEGVSEVSASNGLDALELRIVQQCAGEV